MRESKLSSIDWQAQRIVKVLIANKYFFLNGGSEKVFFQERDFLLRQGVHVIDFSMDDPRNFPSDYANYFVSNIDYHTKRGVFGEIKKAAKFIHSPEAIRKIERLVEKEKPDIAHLHNIYHQLTPSIIPVLKKSGAKVVLTLHDGKLICPGYLMLDKGKICTSCQGHSFWMPIVKNCQGSRSQGFLLALEAYWHKWAKSYEKVDIYLTPSRFLGDLVSIRMPKEKIRLLHNGIDVKSYTPSFCDEGYALYFGRLSKEKGIKTLLNAYKNMGNSLMLKVAGTGPLEGELRREYQSAEFLGYKEGDELNHIISGSAFVVAPSECYENCSMVVLEAMAMGKPVIGSRIGGIPEQVEDGKTGLLFEMGNVTELTDKMRLLSENHEMRKKMGTQARKKLEIEYPLDKHCNELLEIYERLIAEG